MNNRFDSSHQPILISLLLLSVSSLPLAFLNCDQKHLVYFLSGIQGIGLLIMLNTATSLISDVIGKDTDKSAFVYGVYSFFEKLTNGIIMFFIIQNYSDSAFALKWIMALIPVLCTVFAYFLLIMGS